MTLKQDDHVDKARKVLADRPKQRFISVIWSAEELALIREEFTDTLQSVHRSSEYKCSRDALPFCPKEHWDEGSQADHEQFIVRRQRLIFNVTETIKNHNLSDLVGGG